jgi:hypothetical protein
MKKIKLLIALMVASVTLNAQSYNVDLNCTYSLIPGSGTSLPNCDDCTSGLIPIGFTFPFYGHNYTNINFSSNGFLSFESGIGSGCCSGQALPSNFSRTIIAFSWDDMYTFGANVEYFTTGTAPNRVFVVNYFNVGYCCTSQNMATVQIQLYETTGEIRMLSANNIHSGRTATMGIQDNLYGATVVPGRSASSWDSSPNECVSFTYVPPCQTSINAICQNATAYINASGVALINATQIDNGSTSNCGIASMTVSPSQFYCQQTGTNNVTLTIVDNVGGTATCNAVVTVQDTTHPVINCASNISVAIQSNACDTVINYTVPTATDNCSFNSYSQTFNYTGAVQTFTAPVTGVYTIDAYGARGGNVTTYYTANGGLGGRATGEISLNAGDVLNIYVGGAGVDRLGDHPYPDCDVAQGGWNGGGPSLSKGNSTAGGGASDVRFNGTTLNDRIIVAGGGGGCGWAGARGGDGGGLTGDKGMGDTLNWEYSNPSLGGALGGTQTAGGAVGGINYNSSCGIQTPGSFGQGGTGIGYTAGGGGGGGGWYGGGGGGYADGGGGGSSYIGGVQNGTTQSGVNNGDGLVTISWQVSNTLTVTQTSGLPSGATFPAGVTTNTFTVTDDAGNTSTCSFTVTVTNNDVTPPVVSGCPNSMNACPSQVVNFNAPTGTDNCGGVVTVTQTAGLPSGSIFPIGVNTVTYTLTDASNNSSTCSFTITVSPCAGIDEADTKTLVVSFAPNPASNNATISLENAKSNARYTYVMYNALGQQIVKEQVLNAKLNVDLTTVGAGVYYFSILENDIVVSQQKVVVSK